MTSESDFITYIDFNENIFTTIENMIEELTTNQNILNITQNQDNNIQFNIEFDIFENNPNIDTIDIKSYFKNCNQINDVLGKPQKINKKDYVNIKEENNNSCLICMESYNIGEFKRTLPKCKHEFHKKCIDKWLKKNCTCPVCRDNLL